MDIEQADLSGIPDDLHETVRQGLGRLAEVPGLAGSVGGDAELKGVLAQEIACSDFVVDVLTRYPEAFVSLASRRRFHTLAEAGDLHDEISASVPLSSGETNFMRNLRLARNRELLRVAWRDLAGWAKLDETLRELSDLADALINKALDWSIESLRERYGEPRAADGSKSAFVVLAMGKLGGGELNFSSDIDLVFFYSEPGQTTGPRSLSNEEYFRLLAQRVIATLSKQTSDGFVYRVDVRLRPFGESGPLAISEAALEEYLMQHGRDWERYAYVKARIVNPWPGAADFNRQVLRPFVYRRYLDYGVFSSLREMKSLIEKEGQSSEYESNIKLGPGGIREIEFIVQSLQLVRGGSIDSIRQRCLLTALDELVRHQCLPALAAEELADAYVFLRRLENRLQMLRDRQVHDLPKTAADRSRITFAMQIATWEALVAELEQQRANVSKHFGSILLQGADESPIALSAAVPDSFWGDDLSGSSASVGLEKIGFKRPDDAAELLQRLRDSSVYRRIDKLGRQRLDVLMPSLIRSAASQDDPEEALKGAIQIVEAIGRRSAYFSLLNENPAALERLIDVCSTGQFLVRQVAAHPLLLDELLDPRIFLQTPERDDLAGDLDVRMEGVSRDDPERWLDALRNFQQAAVFKVAVADISETLPLMKVSDRLTDIAELVLQAAYEMAWHELAARHGVPVCQDGDGKRPAAFGVVGYGKLGGIELGYASDLDLVFLHDSEGDRQTTDGEKSLDNSVFFARLARRIMHILTMPTTSGSLYEVDTRLRPSGRSGMMVATLAAFERYQREDAWTWEHQALLRSRFVAGNPRVGAAFEKLRVHALREFIHRDALRTDVVQMRERMRKELSKGTGAEFDIKQDAGGLTDIEFLVQFLVLDNAGKIADLVTFSDNIRQLDALVVSGIMPAAEAERLADIYRAYRSCLHRLALAGKKGLAPRPEFEDSVGAVTESWQTYMLR